MSLHILCQPLLLAIFKKMCTLLQKCMVEALAGIKRPGHDLTKAIVFGAPLSVRGALQNKANLMAKSAIPSTKLSSVQFLTVKLIWHCYG